MLQRAIEKTHQQKEIIKKQVENGEEFISNKFNERFASLQAEKERLVRKVEREEEFLTNSL
jgi:hypothetical protein